MTDDGILSSWGKALAIVVAFGVVGAFIDFYIGKPGQQRVRDRLETWWLRFSYVRWGNFGREEALFAVQVMDRLFGRRLLSVQRIIAVIVITFGSLGVTLASFNSNGKLFARFSQTICFGIFHYDNCLL